MPNIVHARRTVQAERYPNDSGSQSNGIRKRVWARLGKGKAASPRQIRGPSSPPAPPPPPNFINAYISTFGELSLTAR